MRETTVVLNGEEYVVQELRARENRAWRQRLEGHFDEIAGLVEQDVDSGAGLSTVVSVLSTKVLRSVDIVVDLVAEYAPELPLDDAYESEIAQAFWAILGLAYPFGLEKVAGKVQGLIQRGSRNG